MKGELSELSGTMRHFIYKTHHVTAFATSDYKTVIVQGTPLAISIDVDDCDPEEAKKEIVAFVDTLEDHYHD